MRKRNGRRYALMREAFELIAEMSDEEVKRLLKYFQGGNTNESKT